MPDVVDLDVVDLDVVDLDEVDATMVDLVGGKGAQLGELRRIDGVTVPPGFVVTTAAFRRATTGSVPGPLRTAIDDALHRHGADAAYAVRSSATAEDLPGASFAGQYESYLDVVGVDAVVEHVQRCWASLTADRAVAYRTRQGFDDVAMAVVVQRMVPAVAAGVVFTADPVTSDRTVVTVEAVRGPSDAFVSGRVAPDVYRLRDGDDVPITVASPHGGPVLATDRVITLARLARRIEDHAGTPQDIEWCLTDEGFSIVQARPVTTLFPVPEEPDDGRHVYLSVGHQQMMTDPLKALGLSVWQHTTMKRMAEAGGRLWVDVTAALTAPTTRTGLIELMGRSDPLLRDAIETVVAREGFLPPPPAATPPPPRPSAPTPPRLDDDVVAGLVARSRESLAALEAELAGLAGPPLFDALRAEFERARAILFDPTSMRVIHAGHDAAAWLGDHLGEWLGEPRAVDVLSRSVDDNVTSEMGLALLGVADVVRRHPDVVAHLDAVAGERPDGRGFLDELQPLAGGPESLAAIEGFLDAYGMRCAGEIDVTRPRWADQPAALVPMLLSDVAGAAPGDGPARFAAGRRLALAARDDVLARVRALPDGERRAELTAREINRVRAYTGYREYPKFDKVCRTHLYRQAFVREAERLVQEGVLREVDDAFHLRFGELETVVRTGTADLALVDRRRREFALAGPLTPPRVLTSDGECLFGRYHRDDVPAGALPGLAVSSGVVEGRARVVDDPGGTVLAPGDVLVTTFTDPSWTPLFVAAAGLVTEVGGMMTHGAVVAREYGLPAVVGVVGATTVIPDGARIRVDGTGGFVELLS